jgi:GMP synthase (glutamine-hydrolysing)
MTDVLVIQNSKIEGLGTLESLLKSDGFQIRTVYAKKEKIPNDPYALLIILGANESANDNFSYLYNEQKLIRKSVENKIPVLGICLGSQLIAKAFGSKVYPGSVKEIGFYDDVIVDNNSYLFSGIKNPTTVFHWHNDTFDLPLNSIKLAHSKNYPNQAFQYQSAIGVQFHLEVNQSIVKLWLEKAQEKFLELFYIHQEKILIDIDEKIPIVQNNMNIFYKNFKSKFNL